ncbi:MAG: Macrolide export ATP-binding/permease protein MacB [Chroococcidiopsis cubana SAG 39.79]|uniref:ABC transporter permease n=1 Tax=Chroococcidiopsis cubana SAG 39.79 TaxID=388085 RepID=A0AB37U9V4_9CYAN|nr:ABC transporter permease [Chroococcidiopsis cubana]MDZ4875393.1 Macrolide export ATP-binding/permease protein MacB [Chroococcidiopsis cubana SAG 39.79]PSB64644.1 macrolide ABC transporter ATP-binding protein [Chroococcidiopsis cubana CCALA 043]RUT02273.1 ABC transporter permease [Chroococcidiopsis cubana SAG 39.79]
MSLSPVELLILTFDSLRSNPLRSALTALGVFMGVAAVSATLQVGSISRIVIAQRLAERDAPQIMVGLNWQAGSDLSAQMSLADLEFFRQRLSGLRASSGAAWVGSAETVFQTEEASPQMMAVTPDFLLTLGRPLEAGRFFTAADFANYRPVVAIDRFLADKLFKDGQAVGQRLYANDRPYVVVGVVPTKMQENAPPEGQLLVPLPVYSSLTGSRAVDTIQLRPRRIEDLEAFGNRVQQLLAQRFPGRSYWSWNNVEDIIQQQKIMQLASQALTVVGAISLLVGGVGIANITIASVIERTPEIGLRRALGATQQDIMAQFILEVALLSLIGGTIAIGTVHGIAIAVADTFNLPYQFEPSTASLALASALLVGMGAGFIPALRASQLDPVKALRSE